MKSSILVPLATARGSLPLDCDSVHDFLGKSHLVPNSSTLFTRIHLFAQHSVDEGNDNRPFTHC
jgi:hypothetical protein